MSPLLWAKCRLSHLCRKISLWFIDCRCSPSCHSAVSVRYSRGFTGWFLYCRLRSLPSVSRTVSQRVRFLCCPSSLPSFPRSLSQPPHCDFSTAPFPLNNSVSNSPPYFATPAIPILPEIHALFPLSLTRAISLLPVFPSLISPLAFATPALRFLHCPLSPQQLSQ